MTAMVVERERRDSGDMEGAAQELSQAREQLAAVREIHNAVAGHLDRKALFKAVAEALQRVSPARRVILLLPDADPAALRVYAAHGEGGTRFFEGESIPRATTMPGWVVEHGRPLTARRADEIREQFPTSYEKLRREGMESVAVVPLLASGRCMGALSLMAEQAGAWDNVPQRLLEEIAASVGVALDSSVNYEEIANLRDEQQAQLDINRAVARHLRRDELFAALARCLGGLLPYDRFGIELPVSGDRLRAHVLAQAGGAAAPAHVEELPAAGTACRWVEQNRQWMVSSSRDELREGFPVTFQVMARERMESLCAVPLVAGERCRGVLFFMKAGTGAYENLRRGLLEQVASAVAVALDNCLAYEEVQSLRDRLAAENVYLQEEIRQEHNFEEIVGRSAALQRALQDVVLVAPTESTVLIHGETGTGKELVARAVHARSRRASRPLIKVNCAAIPAGLAESELFGHEKGAFTGATQRRSGRFELADGGTIFLDEVGELPPEVQVKLLRVLQEQEFERVGGTQTIKVDVRVIAATNRDLEAAARDGKFRQDLYYRLAVFPLHVPPLRERRDDVPLLVHYFVRKHATRIGRSIEGIPARVMQRLVAYDWPGNVRELENLIERAVILSAGPDLEIAAGPAAPPPAPAPAAPPRPSLQPATAAARSARPDATTLEQLEREHIVSTLRSLNWVVEGPRGAAVVLGLHPNTLRSRMKKLSIHRSTDAIASPASAGPPPGA